MAASSPQTWNVLQAIQWRLFQDFKVSGVNPLTDWSTVPNPLNASGGSDLSVFGANTNGSVTKAMYMGFPKYLNSAYVRQMHILPFAEETVSRWYSGGGVKDEGAVYIRLCYSNLTDWYQCMQDICNARDALHVILQQHAEMPNAATVQASHEAMKQNNLPVGYFHDAMLGEDWDCWGLLWSIRQQYVISGGFIS